MSTFAYEQKMIALWNSFLALQQQFYMEDWDTGDVLRARRNAGAGQQVCVDFILHVWDRLTHAFSLDPWYA